MRIRDDVDAGNDDYEFGVNVTFGAYFSKTNSSLTIFNDTLEQVLLYGNNDDNDVYVGDTELGTAITLTFTPSQANATAPVIWTCAVGNNTALFRFVPTECRH